MENYSLFNEEITLEGFGEKLKAVKDKFVKFVKAQWAKFKAFCLKIKNKLTGKAKEQQNKIKGTIKVDKKKFDKIVAATEEADITAKVEKGVQEADAKAATVGKVESEGSVPSRFAFLGSMDSLLAVAYESSSDLENDYLKKTYRTWDEKMDAIKMISDVAGSSWVEMPAKDVFGMYFKHLFYFLKIIPKGENAATKSVQSSLNGAAKAEEQSTLSKIASGFKKLFAGIVNFLTIGVRFVFALYGAIVGTIYSRIARKMDKEDSAFGF